MKHVLLGMVLAGCGTDKGADSALVEDSGAVAASADPTRWEPLTGEEALPLPVCPEWWCLGVTDPALERAADGSLVMWFSAGGDESSDGPVLGRATSSDGGVSFSVSPDEPIRLSVEGAWDVHRETPAMRYDADTDRWTTWYLGYAVDFFTDPGIGQATSADADGTAFGASEAPIYRPDPGGWDAAFISGASVVVGADGVWRLYYAGIGTTQGVGLLESTDGQTWTPHPDNPVLERDLSGWDQAVMEPEVHLIGDRYYMWYTGYEEPLDLTSTPMSIGLATSEDGVHWSRHDGNPIISPGTDPGAWNGLRIVSPSVLVEDDGGLLMAVHGQSEADAEGALLGRIGLYRALPD